MEDTSILQKRLDEARHSFQQKDKIMKQRKKILKNALDYYPYPKLVITVLCDILPIYQESFFEEFVDIIGKALPLEQYSMDSNFIITLMDFLDPRYFQVPHPAVKSILKERFKDAILQGWKDKQLVLDYSSLKDNLKVLTEKVRTDLKQRSFQRYLVMKTAFEKIQHKDILRNNILKYTRNRPVEEIFLRKRGSDENGPPHEIALRRKYNNVTTNIRGDFSSFYIGDFDENGRYNNGFINIFENKYVYKGGTQNGKYSGKDCEYVSEDGNTVYKGDFENSERNGNGILTKKNQGTVHIGKFKDDKEHGEGTEYISNNGKHEVRKGTWNMGKKIGTFIMTDNDTGEQYQEKWINGTIINSRYSKSYTDQDQNELKEVQGEIQDKDLNTVNNKNEYKRQNNPNYSSPYTQNEISVDSNQQPQQKFVPKQQMQQSKQEAQEEKKGFKIF